MSRLRTAQLLWIIIKNYDERIDFYIYSHVQIKMVVSLYVSTWYGDN